MFRCGVQIVMAPRRKTRLTRLEPGEDSGLNEVRELREQMAALVGVVQQQAEASLRQEKASRRQEEASSRQEEASRRQEKVSRRQAEQIERLQELMV